jgi:hypothetical protein
LVENKLIKTIAYKFIEIYSCVSITVAFRLGAKILKWGHFASDAQDGIKRFDARQGQERRGDAAANSGGVEGQGNSRPVKK